MNPTERVLSLLNGRPLSPREIYPQVAEHMTRTHLYNILWRLKVNGRIEKFAGRYYKNRVATD